MIEVVVAKLTAFIASYGIALLGVASLGGLLKIILSKWLNEARLNAFGKGSRKLGEWAGTAVTYLMAKWKYSKPFWNTLIEPYFIIFIKKGVTEFLIGFVDDGLLSDNEDEIKDA